MSENFESTYESSIPSDNPVFVNSGLKGGDDGLSFYGVNHWDEDYLSTLNVGSYISNNSPDTISFNTSLFGNDHLTFNPSPTFTIKMTEDTNKNGFWKYNEDKILKQLEEYITSTYRQHYVDRTGGGKEQTLDKIKHNRREGFCAGNVTKYIDRYDTKGTPRADLFKVLHYTILLINHLNLIENK
jgi:hypothetical protein